MILASDPVSGSVAPLRVLALSTLFPDASRPNFGIFVERSLTALASQPGVDVTVVAPLGIPPWPLSRAARYRTLAALPAAESWRGLSVLRPRWRLWPGMGAAANGARIAAAVLPALRGLPAFDAIDAHFFHPDAVAAQRLAQALSIPFRVTARGTDIAYWASAPATAAGIRNAASAASGIFAVSAALRTQMIALGFPGERIAVHHTGVDRSRFRPQDRETARAGLGLQPGPVILSVGTLNENKGQYLVIDALPALAGVTYLIAGEGPDRAALEARARASGLGDRVRFLGSVPHADLPALYAAVDVVVQVSAREGLANVWVEAMACGTPVVAADIPPAHEAIDSPLAGRVVARTPAAIAAAIGALLADPPDPAALSARTHARFDWDAHGQRSAAHLRQIVQTDGKGGSGGGT